MSRSHIGSFSNALKMVVVVVVLMLVLVLVVVKVDGDGGGGDGGGDEYMPVGGERDSFCTFILKLFNFTHTCYLNTCMLCRY